MTEEQRHDLYEAFASGGKSVQALGIQLAELDAARQRNFRVNMAVSVLISVALVVLAVLFVVVEHEASDVKAQLKNVGNNNRFFTRASVECQLGDTLTVPEFEACVQRKVGPGIYPAGPK